jgi:ubiquinone biosynthesis protein
LDSVVNRLVLGILTSSLVLGSSLLWSMKAPPAFQGVSVMGALGFLAATVLGAVLFRAVRRSGKTVSKD